MQARKFTKYSSLELTPAPQEAFSRLYSIAPLYIGSSGIESLTSYISRLALSHRVYPGILMKTIINSLANKQYSSNNIYQIYNHTAIVNGTGIMTSDLSDVLIKLTHQKDLHLLNLTSLSKLLPSRRLMNRHRSWCPHCYEEWRTYNFKIYDPLLWAIKTVKVCPKHHVPLE